MPVTPPGKPEPPRRARRWLRRVGIAVGGLVFVWFVLALGVWIVTVEIPASRLSATVAALEARGETLDIAVLAPPAIPDEDNAAVLLREAFQMLNKIELEGKAEHGRWKDAEILGARSGLERDPAWVAERAWVKRKPDEDSEVWQEHEAGLHAYLAKCRPALELVERALARPHCRFDRDYSFTGLVLTNVLSFDEDLSYGQFRELARLLSMRAFVKTMDGDPDGAAADCILILKLSGTFAGEPILMSHLMRSAISGVARDQVEQLLAAQLPSPTGLASLADAFSVEDQSFDLAYVMRGERALAYESYHTIFLELPHSFHDGATEEQRQKEWRKVQLRRGSHYYGRFVRACQQYSLEVMAPLVDAAQLPLSEAIQVSRDVTDALDADGIGTWLSKPKRLVIDLQLVGGEKLFRANANGRTRLRIAAVGCRLAANMASGAPPPESLAHVPAPIRIDPFSESDLLLRRDAHALVIYSVGPNMRDDGGVNEDRNPEGSPDIKDDITFTIPLRTQPSR